MGASVLILACIDFTFPRIIQKRGIIIRGPLGKPLVIRFSLYWGHHFWISFQDLDFFFPEQFLSTKKKSRKKFHLIETTLIYPPGN